MALLLHFVLLLSPETERLLLGPSPFFRHEGMERAVREGDVDLLLRAAGSVHWDARLFAAAGLGPKTPPELLRDPVAVVRRAAVEALGPAAPEEALLALLRDADDAVRAEAAWALRGRGHTSALRPLLRDPSPTVRAAALAATGGFSRLKTLATRRDLDEAVPALAALGRAGGPSEGAFLLGRLKKALKDNAKARLPLYLRAEPAADWAVARAVGELAARGVTVGGRDLPMELHKLVDRTDLKAPAAILLAEAVAAARDAEGAGRILDAQLAARVRSKLPDAYLDPGLQSLLHALSREPWPELAPLLMPHLEVKSQAVRVAVARALLGHAARPALRDEAPEVRAIACANVGSVKPLLGMLGDGAPEVAAAAARALGRLGDPEAARPLEAALVHPSDRVRLAAVGALLRLAYPERTDALVRVALDDESPRVRAAAGAVLGFLEEEEAVLPRAIAALDAPAEDARARAIELVHALTPARLGYDPQDPAPGFAMWSEWLRRKQERPARTGGFRYHVEDLRRKGIDLVLVLDATGSMSGLVQATKRKLEEVAEGLRRVVPDLRVRVVAYRDRGDAFETLGSPLTHDLRILEDFLACVPAWGGGDAPEGVLGGMREAIAKTPWRGEPHRMVVLFGDSPPHADDLPLLEAIVKEFPGVVHAVDVGNYGRGGVGAVMEQFKSIADWGRGTAVHLADEEDLLRNLLVLALGPRYRVAVETLFGL